MSRSLVLAFLVLLSLPSLAGDVTVGWIARTPELDYAWGSADSTAEGWPLAGTTVTWRAHVRSFETAPRTMSYVWRVDGAEVKRGIVNVAANGIATVDLPWLWTFDRHRIAFGLEGGSELEVFSDALSVGFWVERSFYDHFRASQAGLGIGSTGFEDWAQRTIALWNDMAALAVYPETPHGVLDRYRLQKIVVVPDGALPLSGLPAEATLGAGGSTHPDQHDRTVDLMWGFKSEVLSSYGASARRDPLNWFYTGVGALHEMGHARYLVDVYAWDARHEPPYFVIDVTANGSRITGSQRGLVHRTAEQGVMNKHYSYIDRYSAIAMNLIAGRRATMGNYNEPRNFAAFLNDFPAQNRLTIRDANGIRIANADVYVHQAEATMPTEKWYGARFDDTPDLTLRTDANGQVLLGRSPFAPDGKVVHAPQYNSGVAIVRVVKDGVSSHGFLESRLFNLEYWRGNTQLADHELVVGRECSSEGPRIGGPSWDEVTSGPVTLSWDVMVEATKFRVYASTDLGKPRVIGVTTGNEVTVRLDGRVYWWVEAELGVCGTRRSYPGRFFANNGSIVRRRAARN